MATGDGTARLTDALALRRERGFYCSLVQSLDREWMCLCLEFAPSEGRIPAGAANHCTMAMIATVAYKTSITCT